MEFWDTVAKTEPHANSLHLAPYRQPHQHLITQFLQAGYSSWDSSNSVKALKVQQLVSYNNNNNDRLTAFDPGQPG